MGQAKSKDFDQTLTGTGDGVGDFSLGYPQAGVSRRDSKVSNEEKRRRRKWRKKQGYSLPGAGLARAPEDLDLPPGPAGRGAVLVSYSRSDADRFAPLRPRVVVRRPHQASCDDLSIDDFSDTPLSVR